MLVIEVIGYDGVMNILVGIVGGLMIFGVFIYFLGCCICKWFVKILWLGFVEGN